MNGVVLAVVVVLVTGAAGYAYFARSGALARTSSLDSIVVVFASRGEDGAEVAQVIALATDGGSSVRLLDPQQAASIPGTSYDKLADAYPFGGGGAVATALAERSGAPSAYVDVPEAEWIALMQRGGTVRVILPKPLEAFDGERLVSFAEGTQTVPAANVPALLRGAAYLDTANRMAVVEAVGKASLAALGAEGARTSARTDLTAEAYTRLLAALRVR